MTDDNNPLIIRRQLRNKWIKLMLICAILCMTVFSHSNKYSILTSIQQTNQTFMSYIPYLQTCDYTSPHISPGYITTYDMTPENLFFYYKNAQRIAFWSSIQNGLNIFMDEGELLKVYDGIIYRPQIFNYDQNNISLNSTNDIVPLFNTFGNGNLTIYSVEVYVQTQSNFTLKQTLLETYQLDISNQLKQFIKNCNSTTNPGQQITISQLDNTHYIGTCLLTTKIFFFTLNATKPNDSIIDLSLYNISMPINNMILNPILQILGVSEIGWNVFLLTNDKKQTYSCNFNPLTPLNFTCLDSSQLTQQFLSLIQKLWSEENSILQIKLQKLMTHIGPNATQRFPGKINSIFIDINDDIFVQSQKDGLSYLSIFDWQKTQILNISFSGKALLYNGLQFLVQNAGQFSIMQATLPMVSFGMTDLINNSYTVNLPCSDDVEDIQITYDLFISNIDYPNSYTFQTGKTALYSGLSIYTFQLKDYFTVFGPGFTVYYKGPDVLQATLLDASIISMSTYIFSIVQIIITQATANTIFRASSSIMYTTEDSVYIYNGGKDGHSKLVSNPCGIKYKLKGININSFQHLYYGYSTQNRVDLIYCLCKLQPKALNKCQKIDKPAATKTVIKSPSKLSQKIQKLSTMGLMDDKYLATSSDPLIIKDTTATVIKNRLFTIVDQQLLVTLFSNGSAILTNFITAQYYDITTIKCINSIVGTIFLKQFNDPSLYLFCQQSGYINQYRIRYNKFIFQRVVPLYGFKTRADSATNLLVGNSYIFVEVDVDQSYNTSSSINVNPLNPYCCVLRIDPFADTVSSIKQVIFASNIQQILQSAGIDVAYYKGSQVTQDDSFIKIYLDSTWMAMNLTQPQFAIQEFDFQIVFASINYNLAAQFSVNITYNMTAMSLVQNKQPIASTLYLQQIFISSLPEQYSTTIYFDYNGINGPILTSNISSTTVQQVIQDVELNDLIVQRRILGTVGNNYLQIMTPMHGKSNTTFDQSIIVIGEKKIFVYLKNYNDQEMLLVSNFTLNYTNCQYFPYNVISSTSIQFISQCMFPQLNTTQIPILNLTLNIDNDGFLPSLNYVQYLASFGMDLSRLNDLKTVVLSNQTFILGMDQGPMQSLTGKLQYCNTDGYCSPLYISSKEEFLLHYDIFIYGKDQFIILTLDFQSIQVWLNPIPPTKKSGNNSIPSTYSFNVSQYVDDNISIVTLTAANSTSFSAILSGVNAYYEVIYFYGQQLQILSIFQRYGNCEQFDQFSVSVLMDNTNRVQALIAECNQNQNVLRLQTYQRINSTSVVIYTGYIQYYTRYGPLSSLGNSKIPAYNPMKLLRLSNTMLNKLFLLYPNKQNQIKLVYQQIDGILADNYVHLQPSLSITLSPLTTNIIYPTLFFTIKNQCYQIDYLITTKPTPLHNLTTTETVFLIIFIVCNVFNIVVMVFFYIYKKQKQPKKVPESQSFNRTWTDDFQPGINSFKQFKEKMKDRISGISFKSRKQTQMRKQTQIELFTTRSK